jgi:hypothetical protein
LLTVRRGRGVSQLHTASSLLYSRASLSRVNAGMGTTAAGRLPIPPNQPLDVLGPLPVIRPRCGPDQPACGYRGAMLAVLTLPLPNICCAACRQQPSSPAGGRLSRTLIVMNARASRRAVVFSEETLRRFGVASISLLLPYLERRVPVRLQSPSPPATNAPDSDPLAVRPAPIAHKPVREWLVLLIATCPPHPFQHLHSVKLSCVGRSCWPLPIGLGCAAFSKGILRRLVSPQIARRTNR